MLPSSSSSHWIAADCYTSHRMNIYIYRYIAFNHLTNIVIIQLLHYSSIQFICSFVESTWKNRNSFLSAFQFYRVHIYCCTVCWAQPTHKTNSHQFATRHTTISPCVSRTIYKYIAYLYDYYYCFFMVPRATCGVKMLFLFLSFATNAVPWLISILSICVLFFCSPSSLLYLNLCARFQ